ncbi:MAG: Maf-like protein [Tannerella sp.]|jgi:septum formation protein|nr:Maf-like protein [Tannerella sp.]
MSCKIILASGSPRRKALLEGLDIDFTVRLIPDIDESRPPDVPVADIPCHIARNKAEAYRQTMQSDELIITADTIVVLDGDVIEKPADSADAISILRRLSGRSHQVITGVVLTTTGQQREFSAVSTVSFAVLTDDEINYYVDRYKPYDKAGAYGIQEWIGYVAVQSIEGSFYNVMGLPVQRLYRELKAIEQ